MTVSRSARSLFAFLSLLPALVTYVAACSSDSVTPQADGGVTPAKDAGAVDPPVDGSTLAVDATSDAPVTPPVDLGAGPYSLVYAGTAVGVDLRPAKSATITDGKMMGYVFNADESPLVGTNQVYDVGGDGPVIWGRWGGGVTGGKFYNPGTFTLPANGGFHYALGKPTATLPASGNPAYVVAGSTSTTVSDGTLTPGKVSGTAAVVFAGDKTKVGVTLKLDLPGDDIYNVSSNGGSATPSMTELDIALTNFVIVPGANQIKMSNGGACGAAANCIAIVDGFFAGDNAERLALVVHVFAGAGGNPKSVSAVIVFKKQ